ncbi:MAG TPA: ABC transporter permease [Candidatus Acidoferrales bacterium]|nr:ABC transporter permease [Candidatus Acidoferrales bacterium]
MMPTAWALVSSEAIKLRRSAPVRLAIAAPALLFLLEILTMFGRRHINLTDPAILWRDLLSFGWIMWLGLFTPALIVFEAICLANMEHNSKQWKQLFALPIPRWRVFGVKMLFCGLLLGASFLAFTVTSVGGVLMFSGARGLNLASAIPWREILLTAIRGYVACWLLIVVHTWLSVRFPGFAVPAGIAFAAMLIGVLLLGVGRDVFGWWYPWILPISVRPEGLYDSHNTLAPALFGGFAGLLLAPLASWDLGRRVEDV